MRKLPFLLVLLAATSAGTAFAQVTDAERAAARELFKQGDELQRDGKFNEALDKFQRAQQVFSAPTNMLRIAECQAALGRLVESTESYRAVVRTPLPAGSPPAFQAAVDQAKGELTQVEPRVPRLTIQVEPAGVTGAQLQIDGQNVPGALIGEPIPLDPGSHRVLVLASGYATAEQSVVLKEHDTKTAPFVLKPIAGVAYAPTGPGVPPAQPPGPAPAAPPPYGTAGSPAGAAGGAVPPPPPPIEGAPPPMVKRSRTGLVLGGHLGWELPNGSIPLAPGANVDTTSLSGGGLAVAFDGGLRFARQWYVGLTVEHAALGQGKDFSSLGNDVSSISSETTALGVILGIIVNPDRTSAYFELGLANRWYSVSATNADGTKSSYGYTSGEGLVGLGLWIPAGSSIRLLPLATVGFGTFSAPNQDSSSSTTSSSSGVGHTFIMLGLAGFYNLDF